jgi:hypothetical protein
VREWSLECDMSKGQHAYISLFSSGEVSFLVHFGELEGRVT